MPSRPQSTAERAAAALRQQQQAEKRRQLTIIGAVLAVLLIIGGGAYFAISHGDTTGQATGASGTPRNTDGYAVVVGKPDAPTTLKFYEDPQCPICQEFEKIVGSKVQAAVAAGKVKVEYHMVSFLDRSSKNAYSSRAANAAYAVADVAGADAFAKFHQLLYADQPAEGTAGPTDATLIQWAVQAGAKESEVTPLINDDTFGQWIKNATDQMSLDGVNGTPGIFVNSTMAANPQDGVSAVLKAVQ